MNRDDEVVRVWARHLIHGPCRDTTSLLLVIEAYAVATLHREQT